MADGFARSALECKSLDKSIRMKRTPSSTRLRIIGCASLFAACALHSQTAPNITINWDKVIVVSRSTPTLQVVVNPRLRRGDPLSAAAYKAVKELGADYVRFVPWLPYPRLAVAELEQPTRKETSWNFNLIDPMMEDFLGATAGHSAILNFSTMPAWLFKTAQPVAYAADPDQVDWNYTQGTELRDPSGKELGDYYARLVSWYGNGGFTDENGVRHQSGYHYKLPYWEVLNEVDFEHNTTPEQYTERYDAIASAIHQVSPETKFVGLALAMPGNAPGFFEYFLDHKNHRPDAPLDMISYHFYASPSAGQTLDSWQYSFFDQEAGFLITVRYVEAIRKRLSPETRTDIDELGAILPTDNKPGDNVSPPQLYWNLAGALYADLFIELSRLEIDVIGESQLIGYPTQFPSVSMMDWTTNRPNSRFWVLKLIKDNFHPGDQLVETSIGSPDVVAQGFITPAGHKLLVVNKRNYAIELLLPDAERATALTVDSKSAEGPARNVNLTGGRIKLEPFSVTVVSW
jgi:hypothetical protein